jgi:hypothetical protein
MFFYGRTEALRSRHLVNLPCNPYEDYKGDELEESNAAESSLFAAEAFEAAEEWVDGHIEAGRLL